MLTPQVTEIFNLEGPIAVVTASKEGAHVVGTWLSFVQVIDEKTVAIPAYGYQETQKNVGSGSPVQLLVATRQLEGKSGPGRGFRLTGKGRFETGGDIYQKIHSKHPYARAVLIVTVDRVDQLA